MDISIHVIKLQVVGKQVDLTLKIAKQFPVRFSRPDQAVRCDPYIDPICKINAKTLGYSGDWLYLVEEGNELVWQRPATFHGEFANRVLANGGWVDRPEAVITVILM